VSEDRRDEFELIYRRQTKRAARKFSRESFFGYFLFDKRK